MEEVRGDADAPCVTTWLRRTSVGQQRLYATASLPSCNVRSHYDTGGVWSALRPLLSVLLLVALGSWLSFPFKVPYDGK
jgi:hypothetical protein